MVLSSSLFLRVYGLDLRFQLQAEIWCKLILEFFPSILLKITSLYCKGKRKFTAKKVTNGLGVFSSHSFSLKKKNKLNHIFFLRNKALLLSLKKLSTSNPWHACRKKESKQAEWLWTSKQKSWTQRENHTASHLDVLGLYSSNSAFIGISRNFANDLTDFYAIKLE